MAALLKLGDRGSDVGDVQQQLLEAGEKIAQSELSQLFFGPSTKTAVLDFQSSHLAADGRPLKADGVVGDITRAALANPRAPTERFIVDGWRGEITRALNTDAAAAVSAAIAEIGVKEDPPGSNRGPRIDMYEGTTWIGVPWCALFVSWCWGRAPNGSPFGVLASALKLKNWGATNSKLLSAKEPLYPGDIGIIMRAEGRGHVGIVTSCEFDDKISLVEGNCGNAVRATVRTRDAFTHFVRPIR